MVKLKEEIEVKIDEQIYGFLLDGSLFFDSKENLRNKLQQREAEIEKFDFIYLEVLNFIGDKEKTKNQVLKIKKMHPNLVILETKI